MSSTVDAFRNAHQAVERQDALTLIHVRVFDKVFYQAQPDSYAAMACTSAQPRTRTDRRDDAQNQADKA
jgi:hypothetical protein